MQSPDARLAQFAARHGFDQLPEEVVTRTKEIFLDTIGILIAATVAPSMDRLRRLMLAGDSGACTVFGSSFKAPPFMAALFNASLPTITQYDEGHRMARGHPAIHIVPAALAMAEDKGVSGRDLMVAIATGYEIAVRIGFAVSPLRSPIHPHGNWPSIGAAVSAGKVLSFTEEQFIEVINSISNITLSTWKKANTAGATIHHLSPGLGTAHAILAALAVQAGLSAPPACLQEFFLPLHTNNPNPEIETETLGSVYEILNNYFKAYPACAYIHPSIVALQNILSRNPVDLKEIEWIEVRTFPAAVDLHDDPYPVNMLAGIFSIPYCLAFVLVERSLSLPPIATEGPPDPQILKAASLIRVVKDENLKPSFPFGWPSRVRVRLKNGIEHEHFIAMIRERLSGNELGEKFSKVVEPILGKPKAGELKEKIDHLENISDIRELSALLRPNGHSPYCTREA